jgi:hypothetical protein
MEWEFQHRNYTLAVVALMHSHPRKIYIGEMNQNGYRIIDIILIPRTKEGWRGDRR